MLGGKATLILRTDQGFFDALMGPGRPFEGRASGETKKDGATGQFPTGGRP